MTNIESSGSFRNPSRSSFALAAAFLLSIALTPVFGEPITAGRLNELPETDRPAWQAYLKRSQANALADQAAIQAEVAASKMTNAVQAPSGGDFKLPAKMDDAYYAGDAAKHLADTVLSYQTPTGGWSKHNGYSKGPRQRGMQWTSQNEPNKPPHYVATFDNRSTTEEMYFLAAVWHATKREDCKGGFIKGLDFICAAQFPNGGWPQVYPLEGGYHDDITFNDDAMTRILELLHAVTSNEPYYSFLNDAQRQKAAEALAAGIRCVLKTQVAQNGKKTVWCAQHDSLTLRPAAARKMEPATLSGSESAHLLGFLMTITNPSPEIVASIESGLAWFDQAKITGLARTNRDGKTAYELTANSTQVYWARFYDLTNSTPVFPGRDGILYASFNAMAEHNQLGYDYYSTQPGSIVNNGQKKWRKMLGNQSRK
jgi:PelA/Pel-15E family pectate lyase